MQATLNGSVQSADIKGYVYNNLNLNGDIDHGLANISARMDDNNIRVNIQGQADLSQTYPSVKGDIKIDQLNLTALHLYTDPLEVKGDISVDMQSTNPQNPLGSVVIKDLSLTHKGTPIEVSEITMQLTDSSGARQATLSSPFLNARMEGDFAYNELSDAILTEVGKHFKAPSLVYTEVTKPVNFTINASLIHHPVLQAFVPDLRRMRPVALQVKMDNQKDSSIVATVSVPFVNYDSIRIARVAVNFFTTEKNAALNASLGVVNTGSFRMQNASLQSTIINNDVKFDFTVKDSVNTDQHVLKGDLLVADDKYRLNLRDNLQLNYRNWDTDTAGFIQYATDNLLVKTLLSGKAISLSASIPPHPNRTARWIYK